MGKNDAKKSRIKLKREEVYRKYKGKCAYCGVEIKYENMHIDHIVPIYRKSTYAELDRCGIKRGSGGDIENLNPSCPTCNLSKSTFTLENWRNEISLKIDRIRRDSTNFRLLENYNLINVISRNVIFYFEKV